MPLFNKTKKRNPQFYCFVIYRGPEDDDDEIRVEKKEPIGFRLGTRRNKVDLNNPPKRLEEYDQLRNKEPEQNNYNENINSTTNTCENVIDGSLNSVADIPDSYLDDASSKMNNQEEQNINQNDSMVDNTYYDIPENIEDTYEDMQPSNPEDYNPDCYDNIILSENDIPEENISGYDDSINNIDNIIDNNINSNIDNNINSNIDNNINNNIDNNSDKRFNAINHAYGKYVFPSLGLLSRSQSNYQDKVPLAREQKEIIDHLLKEVGIQAHVKDFQFGPTVIVYIIEFTSLKENPKKLLQYEPNFKMHLAQEDINILAPIPGKNYCGIEVPYGFGKSITVNLVDLLNSDEFKYNNYALPIAVGKTNFDENIVINIEDLPHGLCAGTTKSGKSVCLNVILMSLMYKLTPDDIRFVIVDPKIMEFNKYNDIPHLAMPVITEEEYFEPAVEWLCEEMERRKKLNAKYDCVSLKELNNELRSRGLCKLPYILFIMDEFNGWFCEASSQMKINLGKLLEQARAVGIHIILAAQRPSADVIEGKIKANLTGRFAFKVNSIPDSNVILDQSGAEKLVGFGDMILRGFGPDRRLQGCFASQDDIKEVLKFIKKYNKPDYFITLEELLQSSTQRNMASNQALNNQFGDGENDSKFVEVAYYVVRNNNASGNILSKVFNISWNRATSILNAMEKLGIVSESVHGKARDVLVNELELEEILATRNQR